MVRPLNRDAPFFRRRKHDQHPGYDQEWLFSQAKDRLAGANAAIAATRTFFFALLSIAAYIGVVVWSTTDEQLLRITPVTLPIIGVEVPLTGFYLFVPWLFVLLHFNLLIHLGLTSRKLKVFLDWTGQLDGEAEAALRNDVANFPLAQWLAGNNDKIFSFILVILVWITLILLPPALLLWIQLGFLAYQDLLFTWIQATAVIVDVLLIICFRAWFLWQIKPENRWVAAVKGLWKERARSFPLWLRVTLSDPIFLYIVPLIPIGLALYLSFGLADLVEGDSIEPCENWICEQYRLDASEKVFARNTLPATAESFLWNEDAEVRKKALTEVLGINLEARSLRGGNFVGSGLPKSNLREAQLAGAFLDRAQLDGANLKKANLEGAQLWKTSLESCNLCSTKLQNAQLWGANLQGAYLSEETRIRYSWSISVRFPRCHGMQLQGADLRSTDLSFTDLTEADLSFANLEGVKNLDTAELAGADYAFADGLEGTMLDINQPPPDVLPAP